MSLTNRQHEINIKLLNSSQNTLGSGDSGKTISLLRSC